MVGRNLGGSAESLLEALLISLGDQTAGEGFPDDGEHGELGFGEHPEATPPSCPLKGEKFSPSAREIPQGRNPESERWSG